MRGQRVKCSHNELAALIKKAAIGKGYAEGIAKDIANASLYLSSHQAEAALLAITAEKGWSVARNGSALFDQALIALSSTDIDPFTAEISHISSPNLLEGMALAAHYDYGLITKIKISNDTTYIEVTLGEISCLQKVIGAIDVPFDTYQALDALAQKTYVPATDASRLKGAGAGLNDND